MRPLCRDLHSKNTAFTRLAFYRNAAAHLLREFPHHRQPQPRPFEPPGRGSFDLPELLEQDRKILFRNADARVFHKRPEYLVLDGKPPSHTAAVIRELDRIR